MMSYFSESYDSARTRFRALAHDAGYRLQTLAHPTAFGPQGEQLTVDVAIGGAAAAPRLVITSSGLHGVEGYAGSAAQLMMMTERPAHLIPPDRAVVHVHALNPHGFAHDARVNENNVDLNRNFLDWNRPPPADHPLAARLQSLSTPKSLSGPAQAWAAVQMLENIRHHGFQNCQDAITQGQYSFPKGLYYGGAGPEWSNLAWRDILSAQAAGRPEVVHLDWHTGYGPPNQATLYYTGAENESGMRLARRFWGAQVVAQQGPQFTLGTLAGGIEGSFAQEAGGADVAAMTVEYGTRSPLAVFNALRADNWLRQYGAQASLTQRQKIKQGMRDAFAPADPEWRQAVVDQARSLTARVLA